MSQALIVAADVYRAKNQAVLKPKKKKAKAPTAEQLVVAANVDAALNETGAPTPSFVAGECGVTEQAVSGWRRTGKIEKRNLIILATLTNRDFEWFFVDRSRGESHHSDGRKAQTLSHIEPMLSMPTLTWKRTMTAEEQFPPDFKLQIESDEMVPRVPAGTWVQFTTRLVDAVRPGDGILLRDTTGGVHFRTYRAGRPGTWEAHATNPNYEPLISDRDGLKVLAILTAVEGRWT